MKKLLVATLMFTATAVFAAPHPKSVDGRVAQPAVASGSYGLKATVPFEFQAGKTVFPAGTYFLVSDAAGPFVWIRSVDDASKSAKVPRDWSSGYAKSAEPKLVFQRDGNMMVLHQVLGGTPDHSTSTADLELQHPALGNTYGHRVSQ